MTILASIIFFHHITILLAKKTSEGPIPWIPVLVLTLGLTCCVLYLLFNMQPPDMGI